MYYSKEVLAYENAQFLTFILVPISLQTIRYFFRFPVLKEVIYHQIGNVNKVDIRYEFKMEIGRSQ